jgi:putative transposase
MLRRTLKVRLYPTNEQRQILKELQIRCAKLWNEANYLIRQEFFKSGKILSYNQLDNLLKNSPEYKALPTDISQEVLKKLSESWKSFEELKKLGRKGKLPEHIKKVSPPKYFKDRKINQTLPMPVIPVKAPRSYSLGNFYFDVVVPKDIKQTYNIKKRLVILATYKIPYKNYKFKRAEILNRNGKWYVHISVEIPKLKTQTSKVTHYAGIDLGTRNLISVAIYDKKKKLIRVYQFKSKELLKEWRYWKRQIAKHQSKMAKSGYKGKSLKLRKLYERRGKRIKTALQQMVNKLVELLKRYGVKEVFIGDLTGIGNGKNYGRKLNELLKNFWVRRQITELISNKLEKAGIGLISIPEYNTSNTCFNCGSKVRRPKQHFEICSKCGRIHSDTNGAINILKRGLKLKNLEWEKIREVHLVWKFKQTNRWILGNLRIYKKDKDKLLVRGWVNNPPVRVIFKDYPPKSSLAFLMRVVDGNYSDRF